MATGEKGKEKKSERRQNQKKGVQEAQKEKGQTPKRSVGDSCPVFRKCIRIHQGWPGSLFVALI